MFSPVLFRELGGFARQRSHYLLRAAVVAALVVVIGGAWSHELRAAVHNGIIDYRGLAEGFFQLFWAVQMGFVVLLTPGVVASVIAGERQRGTLQLLLLTSLTPGRIVVDKLLARMVVLLLVALTGLPMLVALSAFGGLRPELLLTPCLTTVATALYVAALSVYYSTMMPTVRAAVVWTYLSIFAFLFLFSASLNYLTGSWMEGLTAINDLLKPEAGQSGAWTYYVYFSPAVYLASSARCTYRLVNQVPTFEPTLLRPLFEAANNFYEKINFTAVRLMQERVPLRGDPVLWRETHKRFFATTICQLRLFFGICVVLLVGFAAWWPLPGYLPSYMSSAHLLLVAAVTMVYAAATITQEREAETLEVLLSTPVPGPAIVRGKVLGVLKAVSALALTPLAVPLAAAMTETAEAYRPGAVVMVFWWVATVLPAIALTGVYWSMRCRTWLVAFASTVATCVTWYLLPAGAVLVARMAPEYAAVEPVVALWPAAWRGVFGPWIFCPLWLWGCWYGYRRLGQKFDAFSGR